MFPDVSKPFIKSLVIGTVLVSTGVIPEIPTAKNIDKSFTNNNVIEPKEYMNYELIP